MRAKYTLLLQSSSCWPNQNGENRATDIFFRTENSQTVVGRTIIHWLESADPGWPRGGSHHWQTAQDRWNKKKDKTGERAANQNIRKALAGLVPTVVASNAFKNFPRQLSLNHHIVPDYHIPLTYLHISHYLTWSRISIPSHNWWIPQHRMDPMIFNKRAGDSFKTINASKMEQVSTEQQNF